jgi:hypothetical protein
MPRDLARGTARLVPEAQRAKGKHRGETAAHPDRRIGIVVAGDPDPFAAAPERPKRVAVGRQHARGAVPIVKAVAQRDHGLRRVASDDDGKPRQGGRGVIGGQQHAARREARTFLQMQIGDRE